MENDAETKAQLTEEIEELREQLAECRSLNKSLENRIDALQESESGFRQLFENNPQPMWINDLETLAFLAVNKAAVHHYGYSEDEFLSMTIKDIQPPEDIKPLLNNVSGVTEGLDEAGTWRHITKDGAMIDVEITFHTLTFNGRKAELVLAYNITKRKKAEAALRESEEKFRRIFETAAVSLWEEDFSEVVLAIENLKVEGINDFRAFLDEHPEFVEQAIGMVNIKDVNAATLKLYGAQSKKEFTHSLDKIFVQETTPLFKEELIAIAEGKTSFEWEGVAKSFDGKLMHILVSMKLPAKKEQFGNVLVSIMDITKRRMAEEALSRSEERYRSFFELNPSGAYISRPDGSLVACNTSFMNIFGFHSAQDAMNSNLEIIYPDPSSRTEFVNLVKKEKELLQHQCELQHVDGTPVHVVENVVGIFDEQDNLMEIQGFLVDVTMQRDLEMQLRQAVKMEAIGTLAGGIAHDFNNLLMGILGNASLMLLEKDSNDQDYEKLKNIELYVQNGAELTRQLLGFARGGKYEVKPTDLNRIISGTSEMFSRTRKEIAIHSKLAEDLSAVEVDQGQIEQVLLNLFVNAWQAMPGGGNLYLETANIFLDENSVKQLKIESGLYVRISVTDTGLGMDRATQEKIFDPFFTTKEMNRGTGLGLASAYGIIKNHGGLINVYSEKGEGTTFNIFLPASQKEVQKIGDQATALKEGSETVLLVDDEEMILDVGEKFLKELGYGVLVASGGEKAIEIYSTNPDAIDLVVLDMIMPGMSGGETFDRLKEINPGLRVLLSSGYSMNDQAKEILARGCDGFLQKPFNLKNLSEKLREILDK